MATDIVFALQLHGKGSYCGDSTCIQCRAAREIERLRATLQEIAGADSSLLDRMRQRARAALAETEEKDGD